MNLVKGFSDSLNIMAFKWRAIRPRSQRFWIVFALGAAMLLLLATAYSGSTLRLLISATTEAPNSENIRDTVLLYLNIFLANNASAAMGGVLWALVASILLIPLVGYSFASLVPEGDLASIKITDNHKIADSIFLQFVSAISFVQIITLTVLTSVLTIGMDNPGLGIVVSWLLWALSVFATVLSAWFFELLLRKYGLKAKVISLSLIGLTALSLYLIFPDDIGGFFGVGEAYTVLLQGLTLNDSLTLFVIFLVFIAVAAILSGLISLVASKTLQIPEKPKKKDRSKVLLARLGLIERNSIENVEQFLANMIIRQSNIWKPLLLSTVFAATMSVVFFNFYDVFVTIAALIPIMIALVWSINIFGVLGSGTTWLVSLPQAKRRLLSSVVRLQYVIIGLITILIIALVLFIHNPPTTVFVNFIMATIGASVVITQFALEKSVRSPHRYRVHIRGESVLPPNKAFSYMIKLFFYGFLVSGMIYLASSLPYGLVGWPNNSLTGFIVQLGIISVIALIMNYRFVKLKESWLYESEVLQNIVKTVGVSN